MNTVNHTFVICAYKESPFLEECIRSLLSQTIKSELIIATSTPNDFIRGAAAKYKIPLRINTNEKGIVQDWNFAYNQADTGYMTIAHQDDVYGKTYTIDLLKAMEESKHALIGFTDYGEIRNGRTVRKNSLLKMKRFMLFPLIFRIFQKSRFIRRRILSFGCPICCPSVMFHKEVLPERIFQEGYRSDEDWQAWEKLSRLKGEFIYCDRILMYHRIHEESATTAIIGDKIRSKEDYEMYLKFWPAFIAKFLVRLYSKSEISNGMQR